MSFKVREVFSERLKQEKISVELREQALLEQQENNSSPTNSNSNSSTQQVSNDVKKTVSSMKASTNIKDYLSDHF